MAMDERRGDEMDVIRCGATAVRNFEREGSGDRRAFERVVSNFSPMTDDAGVV
jgi:hypothetical protein